MMSSVTVTQYGSIHFTSSHHNLSTLIFTQSTHLHFKHCLVNASYKRFPHQNSGPAITSSIQVHHIIPKDIINTVCVQRLLLHNILNSVLNSPCLGINIFFVITPKQTHLMFKLSWKLPFNWWSLFGFLHHVIIKHSKSAEKATSYTFSERAIRSSWWWTDTVELSTPTDLQSYSIFTSFCSCEWLNPLKLSCRTDTFYFIALLPHPLEPLRSPWRQMQYVSPKFCNIL
jgi:hypothetical protein